MFKNVREKLSRSKYGETVSGSSQQGSHQCQEEAPALVHEEENGKESHEGSVTNDQSGDLNVLKDHIKYPETDFMTMGQFGEFPRTIIEHTPS